MEKERLQNYIHQRVSHPEKSKDIIVAEGLH